MHISDDQPAVMTAEADSEDVVVVPDDRGVITGIISNRVKHSTSRRHLVATGSVSDTMPQTVDVSPIHVASQQPLMPAPAVDSEDSDSDPECMPHSEDIGEVPINLIANKEEQLYGDEKDWNYDSSDEDYPYNEDSYGKSVRRKSKFPRYKNDTKIPKFELSMVFRSKNQFVKALRRYGLVTQRSIVFKKSESDRVRAKCGLDGCPWLTYAAKRSRTSRFQVITLNDEHHCAQNRENKLVTSKVIAQRTLLAMLLALMFLDHLALKLQQQQGSLNLQQTKLQLQQRLLLKLVQHQELQQVLLKLLHQQEIQKLLMAVGMAKVADTITLSFGDVENWVWPCSRDVENPGVSGVMKEAGDWTAVVFFSDIITNRPFLLADSRLRCVFSSDVSFDRGFYEAFFFTAGRVVVTGSPGV
ncbi:hypothetical protein D1007_08665 [Hordeum vulgare]|nr:hypothetical protein D1007_08665 [Hordeum vulgare]